MRNFLTSGYFSRHQPKKAPEKTQLTSSFSTPTLLLAFAGLIEASSIAEAANLHLNSSSTWTTFCTPTTHASGCTTS